jgi:hypothetical protein
MTVNPLAYDEDTVADMASTQTKTVTCFAKWVSAVDGNETSTELVFTAMWEGYFGVGASRQDAVVNLARNIPRYLLAAFFYATKPAPDKDETPA